MAARWPNRTAASACETVSEESVARVGEDELQRLVPTVFESPSGGHGETFAMALAQVVRMRIALTHEVVEPRNGTAVLVREGHRCRCCATGARTVTGHVKNRTGARFTFSGLPL